MFSGQDILKKGWRGFANRADTESVFPFRP